MENHIEAVLSVNLKMLCHNRPVLLGEHFNSVVNCKAVDMEPLSYCFSLLGKSGGDNLGGECKLSRFAVLLIGMKSDLYRIASARCILGNVDVDPERLEASACGKFAQKKIIPAAITATREYKRLADNWKLKHGE